MAFDVLKTHKNPGKIWYGLSVPAAGQELTIGADGTPDAVENPNAAMIGLTEGGAEFGVEKTITEEFFDEFKEALETTVDTTSLMLRCRASQVMDWDLLEQATVGIGTRVNKAGIEKLTLGQGELAYSGVAVISPLKEDPTKFAVFHLYKAYNTSNFSIPISRQTRAGIDLEFRAVGIPTRDATDTQGAAWKQTA